MAALPPARVYGLAVRVAGWLLLAVHALALLLPDPLAGAVFDDVQAWRRGLVTLPVLVGSLIVFTACAYSLASLIITPDVNSRQWLPTTTISSNELRPVNASSKQAIGFVPLQQINLAWINSRPR